VGGDASDAPAESEKPTDEDIHGESFVLEDGEKVPYDAFVLATRLKHSRPVDFPGPAQCLARIERWRVVFKEAKDVMLVGGGGDATGSCSTIQESWWVSADPPTPELTENPRTILSTPRGCQLPFYRVRGKPI